MTLTPFDIPPRGVIIPLHRATSVGPARVRGGSTPGRPVSPTTVERKGAIRQPTFDELARAAADFPDLYASFREPERPSRFDRLCNWLKDNAGLVIGLLFPLCAAAFAIGYFGVRELLGLVL